MRVNHQPQLSVKSPLFHGGRPASKAPVQGDHILDLLREPETTFRFILRAQSSTPKPLPSYAERTRELEAEALPIFVGVRNA